MPPANTEATPPKVRARPTAPPATSTLRLSTHPKTTLAAVSCWTSRVSAGTRAAWAGRVVATAVDATTAPAYAANGWSTTMKAAVAAMPTAWVTYPPDEHGHR